MCLVRVGRRGWVGIRGQELLLLKTVAGAPPKSSTGAGTRHAILFSLKILVNNLSPELEM